MFNAWTPAFWYNEPVEKTENKGSFKLLDYFLNFYHYAQFSD